MKKRETIQHPKPPFYTFPHRGGSKRFAGVGVTVALMWELINCISDTLKERKKGGEEETKFWQEVSCVGLIAPSCQTGRGSQPRNLKAFLLD